MDDKEQFEQWFATYADPAVGHVETSVKKHAALSAWQARATLTAPAAEVPEAMTDTDVARIFRRVYGGNRFDATERMFAAEIAAARDAQWQSTRLRGGVPEAVKLDHIACIDGGELRYMSGRKAPAYDCELYAMPGGGRAPLLYTAAPQAPAPALDAGVVRELPAYVRTFAHEVFCDGFTSPETYNDTLLNSADEAWKKVSDAELLGMWLAAMSAQAGGGK